MEQISKATELGKHAVVIMNGAGWHTFDTVQPFNNVTLIKLPPYSPELNPIEQVWSWLRRHCLSNRTFKGYEDIFQKHGTNSFQFLRELEKCAQEIG